MNNIKSEKKTNNKGFSLVELIIAVAIIALLVGVLAPQYIKYVEKARESADLDNYRAIISATQVYYADGSKVPANDQTITVSSTGAITATTGDNSIATALQDAGLDINNVKMNSKKYMSVTVTFSVTDYIFITNNSDLAAALGIKLQS